jgi:putative ABC transport system substrate-binding protein
MRRNDLSRVVAVRLTGSLMSYSARWADLFRSAPAYVKRILLGESPGDLPVQQPTSFDLVINLKTARSLGVNVTQTVLARADRIIE